MRKTILSLSFVYQTAFAQIDQIDKIEIAGDYMQIALPLTAWATTLMLDDTEGQMAFYKSFGATVVTTQVLKYTFDAKRPNGGDRSFPSGHTSASFHGAASIHFRYGFQYAVLAYVAAGFVGYSRVISGQHHLHDVIGGAIIGTGAAWYFTEPYTIKQVQVQPIVSYSLLNKQNIYGLSLSF